MTHTLIHSLHPTASQDAIFQALRMVPHWFAASAPQSAFKDIINEFYVARWNSFVGGQIDLETGDYSFPGDPVMKPFVKIERPYADETVYAYAHEFFAFVKKDGTWEIARLD
mgnify:FL=1